MTKKNQNFPSHLYESYISNSFYECSAGYISKKHELWITSITFHVSRRFSKIEIKVSLTLMPTVVV